MTREYKTPHDFERDYKRLAKQRWSVQSQMSHQPRRSVAGLLFVPFAMFRPPRPIIVVTYQRPRR